MKETYIGAEIVNVLREALRDVSIGEEDKAGKVAVLDGLLRVLDGTIEYLPDPETRLVEELSKLKTEASGGGNGYWRYEKAPGGITSYKDFGG